MRAEPFFTEPLAGCAVGDEMPSLPDPLTCQKSNEIDAEKLVPTS